MAALNESSLDGNFTENYDRFAILGELKQGVSVLTGVWMGITAVVSIFLNSFILYIINRTPELRSKPFLVFVSSLSATDLIAALSSPVYWWQEIIGITSYRIRFFVCPLYYGIRFMTIYSTTLHVAVCVMFRFIGAKKPFWIRNVGACTTKKIALVIWVLCILLVFLPMGYFFRANEIEPSRECMENKISRPWLMLFVGFMFPCIFILPGVITAIFTIWTALLLQTKMNQVKDRRSQSNQITLQLSLIVFGYFLGYAPDIAFGFYQMSIPPTTGINRMIFYFSIGKFLILRSTECFNPILYNIGSSQMRKYTKAFLFRKKTKRGSVETGHTNT